MDQSDEKMRTDLAIDLREVADMLERNDLSTIRDVLLRHLPEYAFRFLGNWVGATIKALLR